MNVTLNTQISAAASAGTEAATTTYKPQTAAQEVRGGGFQLDIADKVMDNEAYGHGLTADEIMQQAANTDVSVQKDFMIVMSSSVSGEDLQRMQEEGFNPANTDVETYVNVVDKIKVTLAQAGVEVAGYNDDLDVDKVAEITGSRINAETLVKDLSKLLSESDIPVTNENVGELVKAVMEASGIAEFSDEAIKYMVVNHKAPTIENIYKAQFSSTGNMHQPQGYYSQGIAGGSYYAKKADSINWENLNGQLEAVVEQAGLAADEETKNKALENAKWLVASGIELNVENLTLVSDLKNIPLPMDQQKLEQICVTAMENGKAPTKALMTGEASIAEQAREILEAVGDISDEAVHAVAESGEALNIKNLSEAQKNIQAVQTTEPAADETTLRELEAKRQLEEIRLIMTEEANRHLLRAGISIDTTELSELVDALKAAEESMRAALFRGADAEENAERAMIFEETVTKTSELAKMPAAVVGKMVMSSQTYTLNRIHAEGAAIQKETEAGNGENGHNQNQQRQASQAYETLMTAPRKDLGDKISKAFRNVDNILEDMGLETSEANRRAVRILGYNSMEINEENLNAVKEADSQIRSVIDKMTPATTLQMIREQKNPLEMTMEELEDYLNQENTLNEDAEKYSVFLQKLDRAGGISESEREAYIGIYRLFSRIERSDGAVIGSVVAAGAQMNFKNMLSAIRTSADKNMDVRVDDDFGALEQLITKGKAIDEQIMSGFQEEGADSTQQREQEKYYARLSGEINTELAHKTDVEKLKTVDISETTTIEQFADSIKMTQMSESEEKRAEWKKESLRSFQESLHEVEQVDEQIIETLIEYGQSISVDNIQSAQLLMLDRGSLFRQIIEKSDNLETDKAEKSNDEAAVSDAEAGSIESSILKRSERFVGALTDSEGANEAYREIIDEAGKAVEKMIYKKGASRIDVKAAQSLYKGLTLAGNLAREENYEVPMNIKGEITSVNLKIYHNAAKAGKVSVTFETEKLGKVAAEFDVTDKGTSGMVVYENKDNRIDLEQLQQTVENELSKESGKQVSISLVQSNALNLGKFGQDRQIKGADSTVSTAALYQTAKAFLTALKDIEV